MDNQKKDPSSHMFRIRKAVLEDIPVVQALVDLSVRTLHPPFYSHTVIDLALDQVITINSDRLNAGNYFVVEVEPSHTSSPSLPVPPQIVGFGGWSFQPASHDSDLQHSPDSASPVSSMDAGRLRALFVHPDWVRKGIASLLVKTCEEAVQRRGFKVMVLKASLQGVAFYEKTGYQKAEKVEIELKGEEILEMVMMEKRFV